MEKASLKTYRDYGRLVNQDKVLQIIREAYLDGLTQHEIINKMKSRNRPLTRQAIYNILKELKQQEKITKIDGRYIAIYTYGRGWHQFAGFLNESIEHLFSKLPHDSISRDIANTQFSSENPINQSIFEFANLVGAFITYIFIESMHPAENTLTPDKRKDLASFFVEGAISIDKILAEFKKRFDVNKNEMNKSDYEGIRNAFKEIYPHLYDFLEKGYLDGFRRFLLYRTLYTITHIKCVHQWEEVYVHKVGMQYLCTKCHNLVPVQLKDTFEIPANFNINEYLHQIFDEMFRRWNT
jgi:hypothetical protein